MQTTAAAELLASVFGTRWDDTPAGQRSYRSLSRLANIAVEYQRYLLEGRADPAAEIARQHNVNPNTARTWIHRARQAKLLTPTGGGTAARDSRSSEFVDRAQHVEAGKQRE